MLRPRVNASERIFGLKCLSVVVAICLFVALIIWGIRKSMKQAIIAQSHNESIFILEWAKQQTIDCKLFIYERTMAPVHDIKMPNINDLWNKWHWIDMPVYWYESLFEHPNRTMNVSEADLFFLPSIGDTQMLRLQNDSVPIITNGISNHFSVCGREDRHCYDNYPEMRQTNEITMFSYEREEKRSGSFEVPFLSRIFMNPYHSIYDFHTFQPRDHLIFGCFKPRLNHKGWFTADLREALINQSELHSNELFHFTNNTENISNYMDLYSRSTFSVQPTGDSEMRGATWHSLSVGSIPIIFREESLHHFNNPIFEWNGHNENDQIFVMLDGDAIINGSLDLVEAIQQISASKIKMIQQNIKRWIHKFAYYDYRYRHQVKRKKDAIDMTLKFLCNATKK